MITRGIYSATCSILRDDYSLNVDATIAHAASSIKSGLHGVIFFGSTGQSVAYQSDMGTIVSTTGSANI